LSDAERLGNVNRKLQLAREELSSTRLQSSDLEDQASELLNTTENLDSLVALRQTGVANLEAQLAEARKNGADSVDNVGSLVDSAGDSSVDLLTDASSTSGELADSGTNALTEAGQDLGEVELFTDDENQTALQVGNLQDSQVQEPVIPAAPMPWYQSILAEPMKLLIGAGALVGLAGLGALLFWRRRRSDDVNEEMGFGDDVDFIDEDEAADLQADLSQDRFDEFDEFDDFGEVGTVATAATISESDEYESVDSLDDVMDHTSAEFDGVEDVQDLEFGNQMEDVAAAMSDEGVNPDDTISEVDVYLNYGLHGQAEELLNKAVESQPNNPDYARKLLQTYHGQRSDEKYLFAAKNFHARFGGEANPDWNGIALDGAELLPDEPLFQNAVAQEAGTTIETQNSGFGNEAAKLSNDDFLPADETVSGSINRSIDATNSNDFLSADEDDSSSLAAPAVAGSAAVAAAFATFTAKDGSDSVEFAVDDTELADQTLDPAFSFDEADLDATNDFSRISDELAAEAGDNIDFPSFDDTVAVPSGAENFLDSSITDSDTLTDALTMDEIDGVIGSSDDLTLDLDQLSGDLELDSAELLNPDLSDIELPEMTLGDDFGVSDVSARADSNDSSAMETMLDLAKAYIDMGDKDSASSALDEIVKSGNPAQVTEAETLLRNIS
jgi:pilus assembly protein FimV